MSASDALDGNILEIDVFRGNDVVIPLSVTLPDGRTPLQGTWTAEDWEQLDHSLVRYEIIEGVLYMSKAPRLIHEVVLVRLTMLVGGHIFQHDLGQFFFSNTAVYLASASPVKPDWFFIRHERTDVEYEDDGIHGAPDLIIEILSSNRRYDEVTKFQVYATGGVPEYGIFDCDARRLRLYSNSEGSTYRDVKVFEEGDTIQFACLPDFKVKVEGLFVGAPPITKE